MNNAQSRAELVSSSNGQDANLPLPLELWELILSLCDDKALAIHAPRVCKVFNSLSSEDSAVWKLKCKLKSNKEKPADKSWKRFYFRSKHLSIIL